MLQIFRVEHAVTRQGPFQTHDEFTQRLADQARKVPVLKSPSEDGLPLGNIPWCYVFGCLSLDTLKQWFLLGSSAADNECIVSTLQSKGFQLVEYLVDAGDYVVSNSGVQVAFSMSDARDEGLVQLHDLSVLL